VTDRPGAEDGPSTTTTLELEALQIFRQNNSAFAPQLLAFRQAVQGNNCPLPGGYITYILMNKVPGDSLYKLQYWTLPEVEREDISREFLKVLRYATFDCNLSTSDQTLTCPAGKPTSLVFSQKIGGYEILCGIGRRACGRSSIVPRSENLLNLNAINSSIIDFEMWKITKQVFADQTKELQRWGLVRSPPQQWWEIWFAQNQ
jgi:hypothetical protein